MDEKITELGEITDKSAHNDKEQAFEMQGPCTCNWIGQDIVGRGNKIERY